MFSLIKNEFIKLIHRPTFYISIGLIVVSVFGLVFTSYKSQPDERGFDEARIKDGIESLQEELKELDKNKEDQTPKEDLQAWIEDYKIQLEYKISSYDKRCTLIDEYVRTKNSEDPDSQKNVTRLLNIIKNSDWKDYYNLNLDELKEQAKSLKKDTYEFDQNANDQEKFNLLLKYNIQATDHLYDDLQTYTENKNDILTQTKYKDKNYNYNPQSTTELEKKNQVILYRVENHIEDAQYNNEAQVIRYCTHIATLAIILLLILATITFTSEFSKKTIKHLIMCPYGRTKIILSKLIVIITTAVFFFALLYGLTLLFSGIFFTDNANTLQYVIMPGNTLYCMNYYIYILLTVLFYFVTFLFYLSILLFLAIFTKNTVATLSVCLVIEMSATSIIQNLYQQFKWDFLQYIPFVACDFNQYLNTEYIAGNFNLIFSITMTLGIIIVASLLSFTHFKRIEV